MFMFGNCKFKRSIPERVTTSYIISFEEICDVIDCLLEDHEVIRDINFDSRKIDLKFDRQNRFLCLYSCQQRADCIETCPHFHIFDDIFFSKNSCRLHKKGFQIQQNKLSKCWKRHFGCYCWNFQRLFRVFCCLLRTQCCDGFFIERKVGRFCCQCKTFKRLVVCF